MSMGEWGPWDEGIRYDVRVGYDVLWYDQGQYHGRVPVEIRDRETGVVRRRVGDVKVIGNFSPIWVSLHGIKFQLTELLRLEHSITDEWVKAEKRRRRFKERGMDRPGPKDWLP
jgi:hypothetical protein